VFTVVFHTVGSDVEFSFSLVLNTTLQRRRWTEIHAAIDICIFDTF